MPSITLFVILVVLAGAVVGACAKNRIVRVVAWCISAICIIGYVLFVLVVLPHLLQR